MGYREVSKQPGSSAARAAVAIAACVAVSIQVLLPASGQQSPPASPVASAWTVPSDEAIRALLAERMKANGVGIFVGIVSPEGRRLIAYGRSGTPDARPLDGDTVFQIGSVTKVFTTLLLSDMVRTGEVKLDDPASKYLPAGVKMPQNGPPITLADLATHMSGLPSMPTNFDLSAIPNPVEAYSPADLNAFLSSYSPDRQPGARYEYSNLGVSLLGRLLASRAGQPYEQLLKERVLGPLGMTSTSILVSPDQARRLAPGHDRYLQPVDTWEMATLPASGSLRSSANDLLAFLEACLGYRSTPLSAAIQIQREAVRRPFPAGVQLLGWSERVSQGVTIVGHDGGKEGYRAALVFDPASRVGIVILANARTDDTPIALAAYLLTGRRLGAAPAAPKSAWIEVSLNLLDAYAGRYALASGNTIRIGRRDNHLLMDMPGAGVTEFYALSPTEFRSNTSDETLRFRSSTDGSITGLEYLAGARSSEAVRSE